ncbi:MAG: glycosyltransferase, partial [Oscillospiraceae bacterium]|nr:glycosyltransferase [Oscillospiraceae bacterium]
VIYNGISDYNKNSGYSIKSELGLDKDSLIVGVASRLDSQKEPFVFVKIAKMVIEKIPNVHFVYVGDGPLFDEIKKYVFESGIDKNIHLLGFRNDVQSIVKDFNLFLFTSLNESMPYCLIESLCAGVPIAATKVMGNDEVVIPGLNGELFEAGNVQKGFETVCNMLDNKDKYSYQKIRSDFMDRFLIDKMINAIQGVYLDNY